MTFLDLLENHFYSHVILPVNISASFKISLTPATVNVQYFEIVYVDNFKIYFRSEKFKSSFDQSEMKP